MPYIFRGRLCGFICADCPEPLSNVQVRLYRVADNPNVTALAVANPKETLRLVSADENKHKTKMLIAEATTNADGSFQFQLGDRDNYKGEAFEVDVYCGTVPHRKPLPKRDPRQFSVTVLQPRWRETQDGLTFVWDYCIPHRFWCYLRGLFGAWTICGKVTTCGDQPKPVSNVTVSAFDADWFQQDALGSATTDGAGKFRIDYTTSDFQQTPFSPWINVELTGGPDLYFKVVSSGGTVLLDEPTSRGRQPDRENAGACFCVRLCVDVDEEPPFNTAFFTHVGDYHVQSDISAATGRTSTAPLGHRGPGLGFHGYTKLKGFCPKVNPFNPAEPMRYRFRYEHPSAPGVLNPITGDAMLYPVLVGARLIYWNLSGTQMDWTFQSVIVQGSGATPDPTPQPPAPPPTWGAPPAHIIVPDANGWIHVDQFSLDGGFFGPLLRFKTDSIVPGGVPPGAVAGSAPATPVNGTTIRIIFEAQTLDGPDDGPYLFTNELPKMHVNNWGEVGELNIVQLGPNPCAGITNSIDIEYTADHELIDFWQVSTSGPAPPLPGGTTPRGGFGTQNVNTTAWPPCAYSVSLSTRRGLTDGENDDPAKNAATIIFCKD
ncbi:MAG TPA: hypothetical protein VER03_04330 [Bryobacteraceae bacterium]|nr:hypothetical protein [Bryobacteraceae bacterium]